MKNTTIALRAFLIVFLPACIALAVSFVALRSVVAGLIRTELGQTLRQNEASLQLLRSRYEQRSQQILASLTNNPSLKAALMLSREEKNGGQSLATLEDVLLELSQGLSTELLIVADAGRRPLTALYTRSGISKPFRSLPATLPAGELDLLQLNGLYYQLKTLPVNLDAEHVGFLGVGQPLHLEAYSGTGGAVLLSNGVAVLSTVRGVSNLELEREMRNQCPDSALDCDLRLAGQTLIGTTQEGGLSGPTYRLVRFQSMDAATRPFMAGIAKVFSVVGILTVLSTLGLSLAGSRSVAKPVTALIESVQQSQAAGQLQSQLRVGWGAREVEQLAEAFEQAARTIDGKQRQLDAAYAQFIDALAQTLDARDPYTAGHSLRVAQYSRRIAEAMGLPAGDIDIIERGARLHDIGKIGVPDEILQKPARLTDEEMEVIRQHPVIGRQILERAGGFEPFLGIVEMHHENYDGSGYPHGRIGPDTPLGARIVRVADSFDAMTSNRGYRRGMSPERAMEILNSAAGTEFDPLIVEAFVGSMASINPPTREEAIAETTTS